MIDTTDLRLWHIIEILQIRHKTLVQQQHPLHPADACVLVRRSDYGSVAVEKFIASGLVVADHRGFMHTHPDVTEEQWDGVEVLRAVLAEEALSGSVQLTSKQFKTFVRLAPEDTESPT